MSYTISRYHDISCGHRVVGHQSKCRHLHGHNYRLHFEVRPDEGLNELGMVMDFSAVKAKLCQWIEATWDHKFLIYEKDPLLPELQKIAPEDFIVVSFNPTAENIAHHLVEVVAPVELNGSGCELFRCTVEETRKCQASYELKSK